MANMITTYVKIVNLNNQTIKKVLELFSKTEKSYYVNLNENLNKVYGENFSEQKEVTRIWMDDNVGSKTLQIETNYNIEDSDYFELIITSAWEVPTKYLEKLTSVLNKFDKEVAIYGTYEDESYEPIGAFVYAYDYDEMEDYDEVDSEKMIDDDDYRDKIYVSLKELRDSLWESYLEVKKEREEEAN
jgi:hypothetical protein